MRTKTIYPRTFLSYQRYMRGARFDDLARCGALHAEALFRSSPVVVELERGDDADAEGFDEAVSVAGGDGFPVVEVGDGLFDWECSMSHQLGLSLFVPSPELVLRLPMDPGCAPRRRPDPAVPQVAAAVRAPDPPYPGQGPGKYSRYRRLAVRPRSAVANNVH